MMSMNRIERDYIDLLKEILNDGSKKADRTGTGTVSLFGRQLRHKMSDGFPVLTTKKMAWNSVVNELLWFLSGSTNIRPLVKSGCTIWNGDAFKNYEKKCAVRKSINPDLKLDPYHNVEKKDFSNWIKDNDDFAKEFGELGPVYGKQWRAWDTNTSKTVRNGKHYASGEFGHDIVHESIDQITNLIKDLNENPDSRRLLVNAWNVSEVEKMVLPPCHYGFQCYTKELSNDERLSLLENDRNVTSALPLEQVLNYLNVPKRSLSLMFNLRSNDVPLGFPFNIASYALLLEILARMTNMVSDELIVNLGDAHIYLNQIDGIKEQITREPYDLPTLKISNHVNFGGTIDEMLESCTCRDFTLEGYVCHNKIYMPLSN